jgi:hypothetical protein
LNLVAKDPAKRQIKGYPYDLTRKVEAKKDRPGIASDTTGQVDDRTDRAHQPPAEEYAYTTPAPCHSFGLLDTVDPSA